VVPHHMRLPPSPLQNGRFEMLIIALWVVVIWFWLWIAKCALWDGA
jgi:hypothetical protein